MTRNSQTCQIAEFGFIDEVTIKSYVVTFASGISKSTGTTYDQFKMKKVLLNKSKAVGVLDKVF